MSLVNVSSEELPGRAWFKYLAPLPGMHDIELKCMTIESVFGTMFFVLLFLPGYSPNRVSRAGASCGGWYPHIPHC